MIRGRTGRYETTSTGGEIVKAFIPRPLPPDPPLEVGPELRDRLDAALLALGRLDSVTVLLPDTHLFLYTYIRKEAVLSSQIEGTQSSLSDLLLFEADEVPGVPLDDVSEVSNYVAAMEHGLARIRDGFPLSNRLIREIHEILLNGGRGAAKDPGRFRRSQNWIGGSRPGNASFVPAPPGDVVPCMSDLERWLHDGSGRTSPLIKAALSHVQFETIHPFLDGNGRVGRLLITLLLCVEGVLAEPMLYLSLYLKEHRTRYYELLDRVRVTGDWEEWIEFFAHGVEETAQQAVGTARSIVDTFREDRRRIAELGRGAGSLTRVHQALQERPVATSAAIAARSGLSIPTTNKALATLVDEGIAREATGRRRNRVFVYDRYLALLDA
jgi:Fic family protein